MANLHHMNLRVRDSNASGRFYADVLGFSPVHDSEDKTVAVRVNDALVVQFRDVDEVQPLHLAFHVSETEFDAILSGLDQAGRPYGNRSNTDNRRTDHFWGGRGVYFKDPDGHSLEVMTEAP